MNLERWIQRTEIIQQIPAPTFQEGPRAAFLEQSFKKAGLQNVHTDPAGNILGCTNDQSQSTVVVCAHLDTVFSADRDLTFRRGETTLRGQGVGDNSVALAALLELAEDVQVLNLPADIWFAATVGEEGLGNLMGMRQLVQFFDPDHTIYLILEGMALGTIYHRALPIRRLRLTVRTEGGHAWAHAEQLSAIHILVHTAEQILRIPLPNNPRTTLNLGIVSGGTSINSRADRAFLEMDLRSEEENRLEHIERRIRSIVSRENRQLDTIHLESIGNRPGGSIPANHPLVQCAENAYSHQGISPITLQIGSTDASIPLHLGIPAVCVGLTYGGGAHSDSEFIQTEPMVPGYAALLELIQSAAVLSAQLPNPDVKELQP